MHHEGKKPRVGYSLRARVYPASVLQGDVGIKGESSYKGASQRGGPIGLGYPEFME
jgi:hypothetical protein